MTGRWVWSNGKPTAGSRPRTRRARRPPRPTGPIAWTSEPRAPARTPGRWSAVAPPASAPGGRSTTPTARSRRSCTRCRTAISAYAAGQSGCARTGTATRAPARRRTAGERNRSRAARQPRGWLRSQHPGPRCSVFIRCSCAGIKNNVHCRRLVSGAARDARVLGTHLNRTLAALLTTAASPGG